MKNEINAMKTKHIKNKSKYKNSKKYYDRI